MLFWKNCFSFFTQKIWWILVTRFVKSLIKCHWVTKLCLAPNRIWRKQYSSKIGPFRSGFGSMGLCILLSYTLMTEGFPLVSDFTPSSHYQYNKGIPSGLSYSVSNEVASSFSCLWLMYRNINTNIFIYIYEWIYRSQVFEWRYRWY